jgi:hypothetical protein
MQNIDIRKVLCWIFACTSVMYIVLCLRSIRTISQNYASLTLSNLLVFALFEAVVAAITGTAWWTILKGEPSARGWGIAASLMHILIFLRPIILGIVWWHHAGALVIGIVGLVNFLPRHEQRNPNLHTP